MNVKVRLLKDWQWNRAGQVIEVFPPVARQWVFDGVAEYVTDDRSTPADVEMSVAPSDGVETATIQQRMKRR